MLIGGEACDDGWRAVSGATGAGGDGCSATCTIESTYTCTGTPSVCGRTIAYTGPAVAIVDNTTQYAGFTNAAACTIRAVSSVSLNLSHTYVGDLSVGLFLPDDTLLMLFAGPNTSADLSGTYTFSVNASLPTVPEVQNPVPAGSYAPTDIADERETWAAAAGLASNGVWTLAVLDNASDDTGSFGAVSVAYTCQVD
jgi:cysteine-rich repeat protein